MVLIYLDKECKCEIGSDAYPMCPAFGNDDFADIAFELQSTMRIKGNEDFGLAVNVDEDAEAGAVAEGGEDGVERVIDVVDGNSLMQYPMDKSTFKAYFASYMKRVLMPSVSAEEMDNFKVQSKAIFMKMLAEYDNAEIYIGEEALECDDPTLAHPIYAYWADGEESPRFVYFKHGLTSFKC